MMFYLPVCGHTQTIDWTRFTPVVIRHDRTAPVRYEAHVTPPPSAVVFEYNGVNLPMNDEGTRGDLFAGDGTYTIMFAAEQITGKLTETDVFRPFIGYCKLYDGGTVLFRLNVIAEIWTEAIPSITIQHIDFVMQAGPHLVNITGHMSPGSFDARPWTRQFLRRFKDEYDFINVVFIPSSPNNRYHLVTKNAVQGIGLSCFDNSANYGSAGRLGGITIFPISSFFDGTEYAYQHELGHQWVNFLYGTPFANGIPHWPLSDLASGVMGFNIPGTNVGGRFPWQLVPEGDNFRLVTLTDDPSFSDLELYLMGLLPRDSVQVHFVFTNQNQTPQEHGLLYGPVTYVSIEDLIALVGMRVPSSATSQKSFHIASIVVSDSLLSGEEMAFYDYFAGRASLKTRVRYSSGLAKGIAKPFYVSTGGRGELDPVLGSRVATVEVSTNAGGMPKGHELNQCFPNPFNPSTTIRYGLPSRSHVTLTVYNTLGQQVSVLQNGEQDAGYHEVRFDGANLPSGVYFYCLRAGSYVETKKLLRIR